MLTSSILNDVKVQCNIFPSCEEFDQILIMDINAAFADLFRIWEAKQDHIYAIEDATTTWEELLEDSPEELYVKTYICLKVRMMFDPPVGGVAEALKDRINEMEFNLQMIPCILKNAGF